MSDTPAVPISPPVSLQAWERLARAVLDARQYLVEVTVGRIGGPLSLAIAESSVRLALHDLALYGTPERILGLIAAAQQQAVHEQKRDEERTAKNQRQHHGSRDANAR